MKKNILLTKFMLCLIVSFMFTIPFNIGMAFADTKGSGQSHFGVETKGNVADSCSLVPPLDVKSSLILSAVFMCLPGLLEKGMERREIECEYAVCYYTAISGKVNPEFCEKQKEYKECKYWVGELFAIPPLAFFEYFRGLVAKALLNPEGLAYSFAVGAARKYASTCSGACDSTLMFIDLTLLTITDVAAVLQTFNSISENGFKGHFGIDRDSNCEKLPKIKEELEELLKDNTNTTSE